MTAYSDLESAVAAFQGGAFNICKPFDVDQAVELIRRRSTNQCTKDGASEEVGWRRRFSARRRPCRKSFAPSAVSPCRIHGADHWRIRIWQGAGRGAPHRQCARADKPFIAINTAAIPWICSNRNCLATNAAPLPVPRPSGAAASSRPRAARCFDEIGDMPSELQTRSCRCCRMGISTGLADHSPIETNVR